MTRRYNFSTEQKARIEARRKLREKEKKAEKLAKKLANERQKAKQLKENLKKVDEINKKGGAITQEELDTVPKSVKKAIEDQAEVVFMPNDGPQTNFLASPEKEVLYGGAAGGGKSFALLVDLLRYCHNPNHRALLLRRTLAELTELIDSSRKLYAKAFPGAVFKESKSTWHFPSGATALFSYVDKDSDVTRYQGQAFTWIGVDELGHYPTPYVWNYLRSRLRSTDKSIDTYMRASSNPGGVGGWWIKKMFVDPTKPGEPFYATDIDTGDVLRFGRYHEKAGEPLFHRKFIPARLTDNPYLAESGEYEAMLSSLPEVERRRLLDGDWDVAEGAAFPEFNKHIHVLEPFELPNNWIRIRSADYGYSSPSCVLWGAVDWDGNIIIYRELYQSGLTGEQLANRIDDLEVYDPPMHTSVLDASCWSKSGIGPSIADSIIRAGVRFVPSNRDRIGGKVELHRRLSIQEKTGEPQLKILSNCTNLIRTLPTIPYAKNNAEDVDTKTDDHAYDALRYMIMTRQTGERQRAAYNLNKLKAETYEPVDRIFGY